MKYNNLIKNERSKPRLKLSHRIGYSLVKPKKFKKLYKRKWNRFNGFRTPDIVYKPGFQAGTSLKNLYGLRLKSKQALRASYGKISERQFKNIVRKSEYGKASSKLNLRGIFERRLDVAVQRLGFAKTIFKARQLVTHKFFKVNGKPVNAPSLILGVGDSISVADRVWDKVYAELSQNVLTYHKFHNDQLKAEQANFGIFDATKPKSYLEKRFPKSSYQQLVVNGKVKELPFKSMRYRPLSVPKYLEFDYTSLTALVVGLPDQNDIRYRNKINFKHIREYY